MGTCKSCYSRKSTTNSIGNVGIKSVGKEEAKGATEIDDKVFE